MKLETKTIKLSNIKLNPNNPRTISNQAMDRLVKSLQDFPDMLKLREIVVDDKMTVLGGNMRLLALQKLGMKECTVKIVRGLSPQQKREFIIKDNAAFGDWDMDALANSWADLPLTEWGVDLPEDWMGGGGDVEVKDAEPQIDKAEELNKKWRVTLGDVWLIGEHRLLCADSTKKEDVSRVMGEIKAQMVWTDPPWNVAYGSCFNNTRTDAQHYLGWKNRTIINDNLGDKFPEFASQFVKVIYDNLLPGGILYMAMSAQEWGLIMNELEAAGFHWSSTIIWAKDTLVVSRKDYHTQYEPLWYGWRGDAARLCPVEDRKQSDLWQIPRPKESPEHPTMKPVELVTRSLANSSFAGNNVFDPFLGSGTTMVACQNLNRKCLAIEISPAYCAVILQRMTDAFSGIKIKRAK